MLMDGELMGLAKGANVDNRFWTGKAGFTNPMFIQALNQAKAITKYIEPNWQGESWTGMPGAFAVGKAAMLLDGSWDMASVLKANPKMQIGYFPLPGSNVAKDNVSILQPDLAWVVLKNGKDQAAALKWLDFFSQPKIYAQYVKETGISPSFKGAYPSATRKILGTWLSKGDLEANAEPALPNNGPLNIQSTQFLNTLQSVLLGQTSPRVAATQWERSWKTVLAAK
jgi:raffinose/stachyose/melibiose transport system substrate-binding protein